MIKPILNISDFSSGKSTSYAAIVSPSFPLEQDLQEYDVLHDLTSPEDVLSGTSPSAIAVRKYLSVIDPGVLERVPDAYSTNAKKLGYRTSIDRLFSKWIDRSASLDISEMTDDIMLPDEDGMVMSSMRLPSGNDIWWPGDGNSKTISAESWLPADISGYSQKCWRVKNIELTRYALGSVYFLGTGESFICSPLQSVGSLWFLARCSSMEGCGFVVETATSTAGPWTVVQEITSDSTLDFTNYRIDIQSSEPIRVRIRRTTDPSSVYLELRGIFVSPYSPGENTLSRQVQLFDSDIDSSLWTIRTWMIDGNHYAEPTAILFTAENAMRAAFSRIGNPVRLQNAPNIDFVGNVSVSDFSDYLAQCQGVLATGSATLESEMSETESALGTLGDLLGAVRATSTSDSSSSAAIALDQKFNEMRFAYNRIMLEEYRAGSRPVPYFLDLGFGETTKETSEEDVDGTKMHCLERAAEEEDWTRNYLYGDMLRIRAMFRGDKVNKKSAYETSALNPGVVGADLDTVLEEDPTITKISQGEGVDAIVGTATTSDGLYVLSTTKAGPPVIVSTKFASWDDTVETSSFRTFRSRETGTTAHDYIRFAPMESFVGLQRAYSDDTSRVSAGKEFLAWYANYSNRVLVIPNVSYGDASTLSVIGSNAYEFKPSPSGLLNIQGVGEINPTNGEETSHQIGSLVMVASLADSNYRANNVRKLAIEIPYNPKDTSTSVRLSASAAIDRYFVDYPDGDFIVEVSVDEEKPAKFYLISGIVVISSKNSLYEYLSESKPEDGTLNLSFKVKNNDAQTSRTLYIGVSSNLPPMPGVEDALASARMAYESTATRLSGFWISTRSGELTYGNYNEFMSSQGKSIDDFWNLSRVAKGMPFQYVVEVPKSISLANSKYLASNYRTADLFADSFVTKSHLGADFRMECEDSETSEDFLVQSIRNYTGIGSCGDALSLYYDIGSPVSFSKTTERFDENHAAQYAKKDSEETSDSSSSSAITSIASRDDDSSASAALVAPELNFKHICTIGAINRFSESVRHKSNLFSVIVRGTNFNNSIANASEEDMERRELAVESAKNAISNAIRQICEEYAPANGQLFKVYFE